ncbi:MAG: hypothetical protein NTU47_06655 [Ignavibacteriales bacterium]|nr:hypothetical protein [Ignavibacteriales bacterium]
MSYRLVLFVACLLFLALAPDLKAQTQAAADSTDNLQKLAPKVFIDCSMCDQDYIRTEIPFVNYVRDRKQADVHVMIMQMNTGGGGTEYTLTLLGGQSFDGVDDTLKYIANKTDTQDMTRKGLVKVLKTGLVRYVIHTPLSEYFTVSYNKPTAGAKVADKWDYWVFTTNFNSWFNGESQYKSSQVWGGFTASRVTEDWKFRFATNLSYNENKYEFQIDDTTTVVSRSISRSQSFNGFIVKSLTSHWSVGLFTYLNTATYSNIDIAAHVQPGIEYNVFPYSESTRRQLRIGYQIGLATRRYIDTTIYFKKSETHFDHSLSASLSLQQAWGSTSVTLSGSQYLHDLSKNNFSISGNMSIRVFEGLSFNIYGGYSAVHDQLSLPKSSLTPEEVYQQRRELAKNYSYWGSFGMSYSFGSIFNNIVNSRFGNQGGGGTTIIMSD